jgi:hypothetical protein
MAFWKDKIFERHGQHDQAFGDKQNKTRQYTKTILYHNGFWCFSTEKKTISTIVFSGLLLNLVLVLVPQKKYQIRVYLVPTFGSD